MPFASDSTPFSQPPPPAIVCAGLACSDITFAIDELPAPDTKVRARRSHCEGGGPAANAAVTIAHFGGQAYFSGYLSNDLWGQLHRSDLVARCVRLDWAVATEEPSTLSTILVDRCGRRTIVTDINTPSSCPQQPAIDFPPGCKLLLLDGHSWSYSQQWHTLARHRSIPTLLDAGSIHPGTLACWREATWLIAAEKFATELSGSTDPATALAHLASARGSLFTAITCGAGGVYFRTARSPLQHIPAFPVTAIDTTAAGDIFHGAAALALALGHAEATALVFASAAAALACTEPGGRSSLPPLSAVEQLCGIQLYAP